MFTKKITLVNPGTTQAAKQDGITFLGTRVEYRVFGILIYKKELIPPVLSINAQYEYQIMI